MCSSTHHFSWRALAFLGAFFAAALMPGCATVSSIRTISDLPLKNTSLPGMGWELSSMRANAQYVLYGANSGKERSARMGDYYYVLWHDAQPSLPARVEMLYTQAGTASKVLERHVDLVRPRRFSGMRKCVFTFNGPQRAKNGDVLSWRINLYSDGKLVDSRHSYLWQDP